jgi:hypothetical protein
MTPGKPKEVMATALAVDSDGHVIVVLLLMIKLVGGVGVAMMMKRPR